MEVHSMTRNDAGRVVAATAALVMIAGTVVPRSADAASCGPPPRAKPHRRTAGESFPPLPLPATPLRRTEKKRQPSPPALVAKVRYGDIVEGSDASGKRFRYLDWTTDPGDIQRLMRRFSQDIGLKRRSIQVTFGDFSFNPAEIPVLYLTGHEGFTLTKVIRKKLRWFLQDGGSLICDACCGSDDYLKSWVREMNIIFPRRKSMKLPPDHPVYHTVYDFKDVGYSVEKKGNFRAPPTLLGINIGCRTAVFLSPYDLSCGWDGHPHDRGKRVWSASHRGEEAMRLGVNMLAYAQAYYGLGRFLATEKVYHEAEKPAEQSFVFGQLVHIGDWDPDPAAAANLLGHSHKNTTLSVRFRREAVDLHKDEVFEHPVLYMTGHNEFVLKSEEVARLRQFLKMGGCLLADACCGRKSFDLAFRREIARVLPDVKLQVLPLDHEIFRAAGTPVREIDYRPAVGKTHPKLKVPVLEGVTLGGTLAVVYSAFDLGCGWEREDCPFCRGVAPRDALRLGSSMLVYVMTH
jgi:hypothetical protein